MRIVHYKQLEKENLPQLIFVRKKINNIFDRLENRKKKKIFFNAPNGITSIRVNFIKIMLIIAKMNFKFL